MIRCFAVLSAVLVGGLVLFKGSSVAQPPASFPAAGYEDSAGGDIVLTGCQIKIYQEVSLSAERAGVLDMVVLEGQRVKQGDLVAHTRDDVLKATLAVATRQAMNDVEIRFAKKTSELAQVEYERNLQANSVVPGTVSDLTLRAHRLDVEKALLQLEQAQTNLEVEKLRRNETLELLKLHSVRAPIDGFVQTAFKKKGESVAEGEPILELVNTSRVKVEGYVHLQDLEHVQVGSVVRVQLDVPEMDLPAERLTFPGRIAFVDVKVEPVTRRVKVWAEVDNDRDVLRDGLTARMVILRQQVDSNFAAQRQNPTGQGPEVRDQGK